MEIEYRQQLFAAILTEAFVLGYYMYLIFSCILALCLGRLKVSALLKTVLAATCLASVAAFVVDVLVYQKYYDKGLDAYPSQLRRPRVALRICNSAVSQSVVMTRCLQLWRDNKSVAVANGILLTASLATGIYGLSHQPSSIRHEMQIYNWTNMASTAISSGIVISRTLWMERELRRQYVVGVDLYPKLNMLIDSGVGYPVFAFIDRVIPLHPFQSALVQIAAITCGRIVLQTALGRNSRDVRSLIKDFGQTERSLTPVLDTLFGSIAGPSLPMANPSMVSQLAHSGVFASDNPSIQHPQLERKCSTKSGTTVASAHS